MALPRPGDLVLRVHGQPAEGAALVALDHDRPLFAFAGLWRPWTGTRGTKAEPLLAMAG
jgi:putative SOS response-associated peptidase YedK